MDLLIARPDVDPDRIAYVGVSYGGAMGGLLAGVEDRLQAYVLVVGDGGLVAHYTNPDELLTWPKGPFYRLAEGQQERWLEAMWPIESIHFVGRAAPAALLFQNGLDDTAVPPYDAARYHEAGSEPKEIRWYDSGHGLPARADVDRLIWLQRYIGAGNLLFLAPNYRTSAVLFDRLVLVWVLATLGALGFVCWDLVHGASAPRVVKLVWVLAIVVFGPLGLLAYLLSLRRPQAAENPLWRALGAAMYSAVGCAVGFVLLIALLMYVVYPRTEPGTMAVLTLFYAVPFAVGLLVFRAPLLASRIGGKYGVALYRGLLGQVISANLAFVGMLPTAVTLLNRWFTLDFDIGSPFFAIIVVLVAMACLVLVYPYKAWAARRGFCVWPGRVPSGQEDPPGRDVPVPSLRRAWVPLLLSTIPLIILAGLIVASPA